MTTKPHLHSLIERLPDSRLDAARAQLEELCSAGDDDRLANLLLGASEDDEPYGDVARRADDAAWERVVNGDVTPWDEVKRSLTDD